MNDLFAIRNMTKGRLPSLPFRDMKDKILGKKYSLSLVFIGEQRSKTLNKKYRKKDKSTNVLSFPLAKDEGEILITPKCAERQAKEFGKTNKQMLGYLFVHGMLHLNGMQHSSKMEQAEKKFCRMFKI